MLLQRQCINTHTESMFSAAFDMGNLYGNLGPRATCGKSTRGLAENANRQRNQMTRLQDFPRVRRANKWQEFHFWGATRISSTSVIEQIWKENPTLRIIFTAVRPFRINQMFVIVS